MEHQEVLDLLENSVSGLTPEELSKELEEELMIVRKELMRLSEENLVESFEKDEEIYWKIKEKSDEEKEMEKRAFQ